MALLILAAPPAGATPVHAAGTGTTNEGSTLGAAEPARDVLAATLAPSFTTVAPPSTEGPGGPILVISSAANPFSRYPVEILRAEGLNAFTAMDLSLVTPAVLSAYDVVVLGECTLSAADATNLGNWTAAGGTLIAFRPDPRLAPLLGLTSAAGTLSNAYLLVNTATGPGVGIVSQTMQFHGTADLYTLNGATAVATLYSNASTPTPYPAVSTIQVGSNGGRALAFTYDLARSVVYTRQGNPAWAGTKRDGTFEPVRSDELFYGNAVGDPQPDWIDFNKIAIPQADEQQRLLANAITLGDLHRMPLPRFWYLPKGLKAAIVMTGDNHTDTGVAPRLDIYRTQSTSGCSVDDWECVRATAYFYVGTVLTPAQATFYKNLGFELALHINTGCLRFTRSQYDNFISTQVAAFSAKYPDITMVSNRNHCVSYPDWSTTPEVESAHGIRFDTNYYYWPGAWVQNRPGMFTGSGIPMRFAKLDGSIIDCYQATTQMPDESGESFPAFCNALLDKANGPEGYYGVFTTNMHLESSPHPGSDAIVASAQAHGVPVVSAQQMLTWLDGRNGSSFGGLAWSGNKLSFMITAAAGSRNMQAMVPLNSAIGPLSEIKRNAVPVVYTTQIIKGIPYAFFAATAGAYTTEYSDITPPEITAVAAMPHADGTATVTWTTQEVADSRVDLGTLPGSLTLTASDAALVTGHSVTLTGLSAGTTYYYRVTSKDAANNPSTEPSALNSPLTLTTATPLSSVAAVTTGLEISSAHACVSVPVVYTRGESAAARGVTVSLQWDAAQLALCGTPSASFHVGSWFDGFANTQLQVTDAGGGAYTVEIVLVGVPCGITTGGTLFTVDLKSLGADGQAAISVTSVSSRDCGGAPIGVLAGTPAQLRIMNTPVVLAPATLPNATVGVAYNQPITAQSGLAPFTFSVSAGSLPPGLTLSTGGLLSGTPTTLGNFAFSVSVTDAAGAPGARSYNLSAACADLSLAPGTLPDAQFGVPYSQTFIAAGSTGPFSFAIMAGNLPAGLTMSSGGVITGTPTANGVAVFTVAVSDSFGCGDTEVYTLPVFADPGISRVFANTVGRCLSANTPCVTVPFRYVKGETAPALAAHVTFQLDPRFTLCTPSVPSSSIHAGDWLSTFANQTFQVVDDGNGLYSVDQSLLGLPCGPTQGGTLFTVDVTSLAGDGAGNITIVSSSVRDCSNLPLPAQPGPPARLVVNLTPPSAISDLGAAQVTSGNGPGSTTGITVTWTAPAPGGVSLYRAPFGSYPEYDDGGGTLPSSATAPGAPWTLVSASASPGIVDHPPVRGSWHYVAFLTDSCGNRSAVSNRTLGSLNYHLGDVVNGITRGTGDNQVGLGDISLLGAHYGISGVTLVSADVAYLDVGPTIDGASTSRPATDDVIDFEDLIVFGINYNLASSPAAAGESAPAPVVSGRGEVFELAAPSLVSTGDAVNAVLHLAAAGGMQGFSARLAWDPTVLEALGVTSAGFVERLGGVTFSPRTGALDATLLGVRDSGMRGAGDVATFRFRVLREGDAALRIASVIARDSRNHALDPGSLERAMVAEVPARTLLLAPSPNPARGCTALAFALAQRGSAELAMYSVDGRRVRTLASGPCEAGEYRITWKGDDDEGRTQTPGVYWARLTAAGRTMTRRVLFLR